MKKVAVVILNWNGQALLKQFLPSVCRFTPAEKADIIVADNGSTDSSVSFLQQNFPEVKLLLFPENYGFAEGYNRAVAQLEHEYIVLLNSDIEVSCGWLDPLLEYCESHADVAACQPKLLSYRNKDMFEYAGASGGFIDRYGFPFCRGRVFGTVEKDRHQYDDIIDIFWATGACLFVRREAYLAAGGLDARFFAHMEEIDLCWRIHLMNRRIVVIPQSVVYHFGGATLDAADARKTYLNFRNNLLMLYKNLPVKEGRLLLFVRRLMDTASMVRFLFKGQWPHIKAVWLAHGDFRKEKKRYTDQPSVNLLKTFPEARRNISVDYFLKGKKYF
ncbi:MAG: glycosyltransferase family 2 protein [Coprobacter sp.]|nr:glycosyltransferase family 2 protein [Coprobacter sp.]